MSTAVGWPKVAVCELVKQRGARTRKRKERVQVSRELEGSSFPFQKQIAGLVVFLNRPEFKSKSLLT